MEPIFIERTPKTPEVKFDLIQGIIEIKGRSNPDHSMEFYKPLMDWLDEYEKDPGDKMIVNMHLEHFNTSSSKCLLEFFKKLEDIYRAKHEVEVNWHYEREDENILVAGEDYKYLIGIPFNLIETAE
jgi:hypothetical protein